MAVSVVYGALLLVLYAHSTTSLEVFNDTQRTYLEVSINGRTVLMPEVLLKRLDEEQEMWHWMPWQRTRIEYVDNVARELVTRDSIDSFPDSIFTDDQLRSGGFILYALFGIYAFTLLAVVCNDYFIPCVEFICEDLKIPQNVTAATFMAVATSCPEFFVNTISTFLTESDMGIGTIVGSALFNALGVATLGGLAAIRPIAIGMRPVTRDVIIYMVNVSVLVAIVWDGQVEWYEAMVLGILCICYFIFMFNSMRLFRLLDRTVARCKGSGSQTDIVVVPDSSTPVEEGLENKGFDENAIKVRPLGSNPEKNSISEKVEPIDVEPKKARSLFAIPTDKSALHIIGWLYLFPVRFVLGCTIPSPITYRRWYPFTFFMCIIWIGVNSYFVSWSMTVIGYTFYIRESVMGMTFLAFGGCLPETFSIFIMSRRGEGGIGVSNALGANSLAILFALGIPWFIKCLVNMSQGLENPAVLINSNGIDFVVASLLVAVSCLWIVLFIAKFKLRKSVGGVLGALYIFFITFAVLVETGVILDSCMDC